MSFVGRSLLSIELESSGQGTKVASCSLTPEKEIDPSFLFRNKTAKEIASSIEILFGLCPKCQLAASQKATAEAQGVIVPPAQALYLEKSVAAENILQNLMLFFLTNSTVPIKTDMGALKKAFLLLRAFRSFSSFTPEYVREVSDSLGILRKELIPDETSLWEERLLARDFPTEDGIGAFFKELSLLGDFGRMSDKLLSLENIELLAAEDWSSLASALSPYGFPGTLCLFPNVSCEAELLRKYGNSAYTRLAVLFLQTLRGMEGFKETQGLITGKSLGSGHAFSIVKNSRGFLVHQCAVGKDGQVRSYQITTPTDVLIKSGKAEASFTAITGKTPEEALLKIKLQGLSLNLCTPLALKVNHA